VENEVTELIYDGLSIRVLKVSSPPYREFVYDIRVTSDIYKMLWSLKVGRPRNEVRRILGDPSRSDGLDGTSPYVFPHPATGKALTTVKTAFLAACRRAGIKGLRFHDLRHTFASRLNAAGADPVTIMELLGHSSLKMTERYTHTNHEQKQRAVERLAAAYPRVDGPSDGPAPLCAPQEPERTLPS
jgi:integrase